MNIEKQLSGTEEVMTCINCGHPVFQSEADENEGNCPGCNEMFQSLYKPSLNNIHD